MTDPCARSKDIDSMMGAVQELTRRESENTRVLTEIRDSFRLFVSSFEEQMFRDGPTGIGALNAVSQLWERSKREDHQDEVRRAENRRLYLTVIGSLATQLLIFLSGILWLTLRSGS